jgi:glyoxylase-like metal-dependent hydrolase (beta-lactamase superfamily II)
MKKLSGIVLTSLMMMGSLAACGDDTDTFPPSPGSGGAGGGTGGTGGTPPVSAVDQAVLALGGAEAIQGMTSTTATVEGNRTVTGESFSSADMPVALPPFTYKAQADIAGDRLRIDWDRGMPPPFFAPIAYAEIVVDKAGYIDGTDSPFSPPMQPMLSNRVVAVDKQQMLFSPHVLLRRALAAPDDVTALDDVDYDGKPHHVVSFAMDPHPVQIFIDAETGIPSKVETLEDNPMYGDLVIEVELADYQDVSGVMIPHAINMTAGGKQLHTETRSDVAINMPLADDLFTIPPGQETPVSAEAAELGDSRAQWYQTWLSLGVNIDAQYSPMATLTEIGAGTGVYHVTGGTHHSLAIEMADFIVLVEAPIDELHSKAVIAAIEGQFPGKAITHVINTHHHLDHAGGLRTFVAAEATVVTAQANVPFFTEAFAAPHTVTPDDLQVTPVAPKLEPVGAAPFMITDTAARVVEAHAVTVTHSEGFVIAYVPDAKVVFVADIYNPGFAPPDMPLPVGQIEGAQELYSYIVDNALDVDFVAGAHGLGAVPLSVLQINAGM